VNIFNYISSNKIKLYTGSKNIKSWKNYLNTEIKWSKIPPDFITYKEDKIENFVKQKDLFIEELLIKKYKNNETINKILLFFKKNNDIKSMIELSLTENDLIEIENILFNFRENPINLGYTKKAFVGLIFLIYVIYRLGSKLSFSSLWKIIINDLENHSLFTEYFLNTYFIHKNHPNFFLKQSIEYACNLFHLRNNYDSKDKHQYIRNTILLQIGLVNKSLNNLKLWLSNYNLPIIISELLDMDSKNYSKEFHDGWRVLRRFRDNLLFNEQAKSILSQNIWFKHLDLENLLKASKQRVKNNLMIKEDENLEIFYLEKINYSEDGLSFTINARDLYLLNLSGFRYEIYIDDEYKGVLIANSSKELILETPITIFNPEVNQIDLEIRNEDNDIVFSTEIILFDFSEQIVLFDEDGNIYHNIFKKLNVHKKYHILMDSDLDCNFNYNFQREYFDGYAILIPFIGYKDNCKITYNNETLFELNFTKYIEKPDFIDKLVLYTTAEPYFILDNEYNFNLRIMHINSKTEDINLEFLPQEAEIIKWTYSGGYADNNSIKNNSIIKAKLYPEMIVFPKHTLFIKYNNKIFKKVVYCNFFEKENKYRLFQIEKDGTTNLVKKSSYLTKYELKEFKYYLSNFGKTEQFYIKNKSKFYQIIKPNKIINFAKFIGFGETIFITEYLFNSYLTKLFEYRNNNEYISINYEKTNEINIQKKLPQNSKLIFMDENLKEYEVSYQQIEKNIQNNKISFNNKLIVIIVVQSNIIIDSSYDDTFLDIFNDLTDIKIFKNLLVSNYPFLSKNSYTNFFRKFIMNNTEECFSIIYSDFIIIKNNLLKLNFSKISILLEHMMFSLEIDSKTSEQILKKIILKNNEKLMLDTPIILFKLLLSCDSKKFIDYFYNLIINVELEDERDENFTQLIVNNLFKTKTLNGIQKHNLKIAMHYINGKYYLKKALEKLNGQIFRCN
jgi:hypothetical protein